MLRRMIFKMTVVLLTVGLLNGCGESVEEGIPANVDMSKRYEPIGKLPTINYKASLKDIKKQAAEAKKKGAASAPAPEPTPEN